MIRVVMYEIARVGDRVQIKITFIDESGNGIARIRVQDNLGEVLDQQNLDCPRIYSTGTLEVPFDRSPLSAQSAECGASAGEPIPDGYTYNTPLELRVLIPVDPGENPCSIPSELMEEGGTPCSNGREVANGIADEILDLCEEWARIREDMLNHESQETAYTAAAAVALVCALVASLLPPPVSWIVGIVAAAFFVAMLVLATLMAYHRQEAEHAREELADAEARLEDARNRYRSAVVDAIRACCGRIPSGMELDPPVC
jgi:hypothetical protein